MQTVILSFIISIFICMMVIAILWRQNHQHYRGFKYWFNAYVLQLIALSLFALGGILPGFLSITVSHALVIAGTLLFYIGMEQFTEQRSSQVHNFILLIVFVPAHTYFVIMRGNHTIGDILYALSLLIISTQCVWLLLRRVTPELKRITRMVRYGFAVFCMISVISLGLELTIPANSNLVQNQSYDTALLFFHHVLLIVLAFALVLMVNRRLFLDLESDMAARQQAESLLRMSEEKFSKAFISSPDGIIISRLSDGHFVDVNDGFCNMLGYTREELLSSSSLNLGLWVDPQDRAKVAAELQENKHIHNYEYDFRTKTGQTIHSLYSCELIDLGGETHILSQIRDITERVRTNRIINLRLKLWEHAATHSFDELMQFALDEIEELTGSLIGFYHFVEGDQLTLTLQAWSTRTKNEFCHAEGQGMHYPIDDAGVWVDCVRQRKPVIHNDYASLPHRKGMPPGHAKVIREVVVPTMRDSKVVAILGVGNKPTDYDQQDVDLVDFIADVVWSIVEQKQAEERIHQLNTRLEFLAMTDDLTGLTNRRSFLSQGLKEIQRSQRSQSPFSLFMIDLDGFKEINDRDGHQEGDKALQSVAAVLLDNLRKTDMLARVGGDEFSVLLPDTSMEQALTLAERLRRAVKNAHAIDHDHNLGLTASIGVASYHPEDRNFYNVIRNADLAMYQAKSQGGNRVISHNQHVEGVEQPGEGNSPSNA